MSVIRLLEPPTPPHPTPPLSRPPPPTGFAPELVLKATHEKTLDHIPLDSLREHAVDREEADADLKRLADSRAFLERMFLSAPSEVACRTEEGNGLKNGLKNDALEETTEEPISRALAEVSFSLSPTPFLPYVARPSLPYVHKTNVFSLFCIRVDRSARRHLGEDAVRGRHGLRQATTPQRSHRRDLHVRRHPHLVEGAHSNTHTLARVPQTHSGPCATNTLWPCATNPILPYGTHPDSHPTSQRHFPFPSMSPHVILLASVTPPPHPPTQGPI